MSKNNANQQLTNLLVSKDFEPQSLNAQGQPAVNPEDAVMFSFDYKAESGQDYGTVVMMIDDENNLNVYFGDNLGKAMEGDDKKGWFDFLFQVRQFAKRNMMTFSLENLNKLKYSMKGQAAIKEGLFESWSGKRDVSWNAAPTEARLMIKHKKNLGENDARFRYIESLYIETAEGERFKMPFKSLSAGKAMLEHVRQGGKPYDLRGNHIATIVEEMNLLSRFRRANQGKIFEGETAQLVEDATHYFETLKHNLKSLSSKTGYKKYFESWNPAALTDEDVIIEDLRHLFVEQNIDARVEQALPLLAKLKQEHAMKEINVFESMMNLISEGTWALPDTKEKQQQLIKLLANELPVGADATNATELLYDLLGDDELFDKLHDLAQQDANADARSVIISRLEQLKDNPDVAQVIGKIKMATATQPKEAPVQEEQEELEEGMPRVYHKGQWVDPRTLQHGLRGVREEELDELSPDTLKSYAKHAAHDVANRGAEFGSRKAAQDEVSRFTNRHMGDQFGDREKIEKMVGGDQATLNRVQKKMRSRVQGISKALDRLEESEMGRVAEIMSAIARGEADLDTIMNHPDGREEEYAAHELQKKYAEVFKDNPGAEYQDIIDRMQRELEVEYGADDNMEIDMDETVGGGNWLEESKYEIELYDRSGKLKAIDHRKDGSWSDSVIAKDCRSKARDGWEVKCIKDGKPFDWKAALDVNESASLQGQYGHSGRLQEVTSTDTDILERIKFLSGAK